MIGEAKLRRLLFVAAVTMSVSSAAAQTDPNHDLLKLIYTKIVDAIDLRRTSLDDTGNKYFFVVTQPGIFIDPKLLKADGTEDDAVKRIFSENIDRVMLPSWVYSPTDNTYYEYYGLILGSYDFLPLPLPDNKKKDLADARTSLYTDQLDEDSLPKPTQKYTTYLALQQKYLDALGKGRARLNTHPGSAQLPEEVDAPISNAMTAWVVAGNKNDIEDALETI